MKMVNMSFMSRVVLQASPVVEEDLKKNINTGWQHNLRFLPIRKLKVAQRLRLEYMIKNGDTSYWQEKIYSVEKSLEKVHGQITRLQDQNAQFENFYKKTLVLREGVRHLNVPEGHWSKTLIANSYLTQAA
jgi:hypothetical protein